MTNINVATVIDLALYRADRDHSRFVDILRTVDRDEAVELLHTFGDEIERLALERGSSRRTEAR